MARNRSNRGSGSARRGRDDAPERRNGSGTQPVEGPTPTSSTPAPGSPAGAGSAASAAGRSDPIAADATPPAANPAGASSSSPVAPSPGTAGTGAPSPGAPDPTSRPAGSTPAAPAATTPTSRTVPESRAFPESRLVNAQVASPPGGGPGGAARPAAAGAAPGAAGGQRPQGGGSQGGPDRPGAGARPPGAGAPPPASGSTARGFGAGVLGGVLGGAAVALLVLWYQSGGGELAALQSRVDQVEGAIASAADDSGVESLAQRVQALEAASGDELASRIEALETRIEEQGATQAQLPRGGQPQLAELEQRLAALESAPAGAGSAAADDGTAALQQAVSALQEQLAGLAARVPEDTANRLSQLDQRLGSAEQAESRLGQLAASVDQLTQKLAADEQRTGELASQLGALDERVRGAESRLETAASNRERAAALALIVGQLEAAIEAGRPYGTQLQALTAMTQDATGSDAAGDEAIRRALGALEPGAANGVPGIAALRQSFQPVANEIVHAARAPETDNLLNRATDNLMRLVTVRPVGDDVRGEGAEARVARAEAALDKGDLGAAVAELDGLEGRAAEAAAGWLAQARVRLGADQAVAQLRTQATNLLSQSQ